MVVIQLYLLLAFTIDEMIRRLTELSEDLDLIIPNSNNFQYNEAYAIYVFQTTFSLIC